MQYSELVQVILTFQDDTGATMRTPVLLPEGVVNVLEHSEQRVVLVERE